MISHCGQHGECFILEVGAGQSFLRADLFSPGCTFFSVRGMAQGGEWSRFSNQGQTFLREDSFLQVTLCLVSEEWPMVWNGPGSVNQNNYSSLLDKNSSDNSSLMFDFLSVDALLDLTHVSRRMAQINLVYVITLFLCRLISDDCYEDCMSLDNRCILLWWMCSTI
jgi:hypothetical protein